MRPKDATVSELLPFLRWERPWEAEGAPSTLWEHGETAARDTVSALDRFAATLSSKELIALQSLVSGAFGDRPLQVLAAEPPETVLGPSEVGLYERLLEEPPGKGLRATLNIVMKATRLCNLRCTYCNYWREGPGQIMPFPVMARTIHGALTDPGVRSVEFIWHGGEPTLLPISLYRKALWLQQRFRRPGQVVTNRTQTNATRLTEEWVDFWRTYRFKVGVSLDGPPEIHDRRRLDQAGRPTADKVREGLGTLQRAGLDPRVLMVVDEDIVDAGAERVLAYLLELGVTRVGILNVVPANTPPNERPGGMFLSWPRYVQFLRDLFRLWWPRYVDRIVLRELADLAGQVAGRSPLICNFAGDCFGGVLTVEPNGDIAACDRYVDDTEYVFGNVLHDPLTKIGANSNRLQAIRSQNDAAVEVTRACQWFSVCHGGCPHDRRMAERHLPDWDSACCGLAPLLDDITEALQADRASDDKHVYTGKGVSNGGGSIEG